MDAISSARPPPRPIGCWSAARGGEYKWGPKTGCNAVEGAARQIEIEGRRIAVTGAGGFIGSAVSRRLAAAGASVVGIEVDGPAAERIEAPTEARVADVTDPGSIAPAVEGAELVVHAAARVREWGAMEDFIEVNVRGTANVLDAARQAGAERVVQISSVVVYGYDSEREQDESARHRNVGIPYIDTKSASDRIAASRGAVIVRPGDVYGPGSTPWVARPLELMSLRRFALPDRGEGNMLPVYVDDLAAAIELALRGGAPGEAYTVWSGERISFGAYFERLAREAGVPPPRPAPRPLLWLLGAAVEIGARALDRPAPFGRHGVHLLGRRGSASNERARRELGWEPEIGLEQGVRESAASWRR
jgi:nucleoside-diphosphate-sugar epimerase